MTTPLKLDDLLQAPGANLQPSSAGPRRLRLDDLLGPETTAAPSAPPAAPHAQYDRFGEPKNDLARQEDARVQQGYRDNPSAIQRIASGVGKALTQDVPLGIAHFLTAPLRAVFAPETIEEARNPLVQAAKISRGGMTPAQVDADVHAAIRRRAAGAQTPGEIAAETVSGFVTAGYDAQRAAQGGPLWEVGPDGRPQLVTDNPEMNVGEKARAVTNLAVLGALTAEGARTERAAAARAPARPEAAPAPAPPLEPPTAPPAGGFRRRLADIIDPERAKEIQRLEGERRSAQREAETDPLTGIANRRAFDRARQTADADPNSEVVAFDLNNQKAVNDVHGHDAGDALLRQTAAALQQSGARAFRIGGDEFAAIVPRGQGDAVRAAVEQQVGESPVSLPDGRSVTASVSGHVGPTYAEADAGLQAAKQARKGGASYRGEAPPPSSIVRFPTADIIADPSRFQFKSLGTEGVSGELKGVQRFNEQLAGVVSVWKDPADGKVYVVNGHHRLELAQRLGQGHLNVQFLDAPTAEAARAEGAFINIAEGRGSATDVAKFLRDLHATPADLEGRGVSLRSDLATNGVALSRLAPDVFDQVATAKIPQGWGVAIGGLLEDHALQREALTAARESGKRLNQGEVTEIARQVRDAGTEDVNQETLFGSESERRGLFVQKAQLAAAIKKRLAGDRRLFGYVSKEGRAEELRRAGGTQIDVDAARGLAEGSARGEEIFDRLYTRAGPIGDILNDGARRVARGEKTSSVVADLYPAVGDAVERELASLGARPDGGERPVPENTRSLADEAAAGPTDERVADSHDVDQGAMFSPARPSRAPELRTAEPPRTVERPALELTSGEPPQTTMFAGREGTAAARSLAQTETAARGELEALRRRLSAERDPARRAAIASQIAEREKLVNRAGPISADELRTRAAAEPTHAAATGPDQMALLSPATRAGKLGERLRTMTGTSKAQAADVQALISISRNLAEAVNVPLRQGRFEAGLRRALGVFKPKAEVARVVRYDMLDTVAHEVGHYLSKKYLRNPTMRSDRFRGPGAPPVPLPREALRELVEMGRDLYGSRKPAGGYGEEGIAEWTSFYVTDPGRLQAKAPTFTAHMEGVLAKEPALRAALDQGRSDFARYQAAPPNARIAAMLSVDERVRNLPTFRTLSTAWLDDLSEFRQAVKDLGGAKTPTDDAYVLARLTRGNAGAAEEMLQRGVVRFGTDERVAPSVEETLRTVGPDRAQAFREYLAAESALERWEHDINPGIAREDAQAVAQAGRQEFQEAAQALWQHGQALIDYRVDAGLLTMEEGTRIKAKNQRRVAFYRVFEPEETAGARGTGKTYSRNSSGVLRQHGSARRIVDPLESVIKDTYETVAQANRQQVMGTLVRMAKEQPGGGRIVEEVPAPMRSVSIPIEKVQQQLAELGLVYEGVDAKTGKTFTAPIGGPGGAQLEGVLRAFEEARVPGPGESKDLVVPFIENGERRWYALRDRQLYDAVLGLGTTEMTGLMRWLSLPARTLRAGATLTLEFIGRNPVKDAWSAAVFSKAGFRPPGWRLAEGLFHFFKSDELYQRWRLSGGDNAAMLGLDRPATQHTLQRVLATGAQRGWSIVTKPIDTLRMLSAVMENATRIGEYAGVERAARRGGAAAPEAAATASLAARDVTIDFAQAGVKARAINSIVAFFNANLRGLAQIGRELRDRPQVIVPRALAAITIPSLVLQALQRDDPVYNDVPRWVRDMSWVYVQRGHDQGEGWDHYGTGKVEHIWILPVKAHGVGLLFGTVPEHIAEFLHAEDPEAIASLRRSLTQGLAPPIVPTAVAPLIENFANQSFFRDRPIVPRSREGLVAAEQTTPQTGETARALGRAFDYPPAKIENLLRGYTGGLGTYAVQAVDAVIREGRAAAGLPPLAPARPGFERDVLSTLPLMRGFTRQIPAEDAESIERVYRTFEANERMRQTWRKMLNEGRTSEATTYLQQHLAEIMSVATGDELGQGQKGPLRATYQAIQELQTMKRAVDQGGTPEQRTPITNAMRTVAGTYLQPASHP